MEIYFLPLIQPYFLISLCNCDLLLRFMHLYKEPSPPVWMDWLCTWKTFINQPSHRLLEPLKPFWGCHLFGIVCSFQVRDTCQFHPPPHPPCSSSLVPSGVYLWYRRFSGATDKSCLTLLCFSSPTSIQSMPALYQLPKTDETDNRLWAAVWKVGIQDAQFNLSPPYQGEATSLAPSVCT